MNGKKKYTWITLIFTAEALLFLSYVVRITEMSYPVAFDQISYMNQSYSLYENIISKNYAEIVEFIRMQPTGFLYQFLGAVMLFLFGNSRVTLLLLNLLGYMLVQAAGGYLIYKLTKSGPCVLIFEGLFYLTKSAFFWAGDLLDFRIDFFASCLYTCWLLLFLCYQKFRSKGYFICSVFTAVVLILCRPFTIAYILGVIGAGGVMLCFIYRNEYKNIIKEAAVYGITTAIFAAPYLFWIRKGLYDYYGIGHLLGNEKEIRAAEQGVLTIWQNLMFYPRSLIKDHLGVMAFAICLFLIFFGLIIGIIKNKKKNDQLFIKNLVMSFCAVFVPIGILTLDQAKSPVVVNVVTVCTIVFSVYVFSPVCGNKDRQYKNICIRIVVILCVIMGACHFVSNVTGEKINYSNVRQAQNDKVEVNRAIVQFLKDSQAKSASVFTDRIREWLNIGSIRLFAFEDYRLHTTLSDVLSGRAQTEGVSLIMQEYSKEIIQEALKESDIVVTSSRDYATDSSYPYDIALEKERKNIYEYCVQNLSVLTSKEIDGDHIVVFARERADMTTSGGSWLMKEGNQIHVYKMKDSTSAVIVSGDLSEYSPSGLTSICNANDKELPSVMVIDPIDKTYKIIIDISSFPIGGGYFELGFNKSFRPEELGLNNDKNAYTVPFPKEIEMMEQYLDVHSRFSDWMGESGNYLNYMDFHEQAEKIVVTGNYYSFCPQNLKVTCKDIKSHVNYQTALQTENGKYKITILLGEQDRYRQGIQTLELCFSDYYNPSEAGDSKDNRNLTLPVPSDIKILPVQEQDTE